MLKLPNRISQPSCIWGTACLVTCVMLLHEKFLQFDWLKAVVFGINLKNRHVKIRKLLRVVVQPNNGDFKIQQRDGNENVA